MKIQNMANGETTLKYRVTGKQPARNSIIKRNGGMR